MPTGPNLLRSRNLPVSMCPITTDPELAARILRGGGIVAVPTETVYGLAAVATNPHAVAKIFAAKQRPFFDPLIVHLAELQQWSQVAVELPPLARTLAERFWPGPLTLVLRKRPEISELVTAGLPTVGVRVPAHPLLTAVLELTGQPLAAPSANLFGRLSPTTAAHVAEQLGARIDLILDGGPCRVGVESTIVDVGSYPPRLLRPGGLSREALAAVIGPLATGSVPTAPVSTDPRTADSPRESHPDAVATVGGEPRRSSPAGVAASGMVAPGMLPQHYAPRTPLDLVTALPVVPAGVRWGLLLPDDGRWATDADGSPELRGFALVERLPIAGDQMAAELATAAAGLFPALHRLDAAGLDRILAVRFPDCGLGVAINDRLERAACRP